MQHIQKNDRSLIRGCLVLNVVILLALFFLGTPSRETFVYPALLIIDSMIMTYVYRDDRGLFLMSLFILYVHYSIAIGIYTDWVEPPQLYSQLNRTRAYDEGIISLIIFTCITLIPALKDKKKFIKNSGAETTRITYSTLIEVVCLIAFVVIFITDTEWEQGERVKISAIGEYKFIFAIFGGVYSKKAHVSKVVWISALVLTTLLTFLGGNRSDAFPLIFILLIIWIPNISLRRLIPIGIPVFVFSKLVGVIRGNLALLSNFSLREFISEAFSDYWVQDTFTFAYFPSLALIELSDLQMYSEKLTAFFNSILYIFMGGEYGRRLLVWGVMDHYQTLGGLIGSVSLNYWFGIYGPIISGAIVAYLMNKLIYNNSKRSILTILYLTLICMAPRWYCYNFFVLFRSFFVVTILFFIFEKINDFLSYKK